MVSAPLQSVVEEARTTFGAAACSVAVLDGDGGELVYRAASGAGAEAVVGVRLPLTRGIAGWVAVSGQPLAVSDLAADHRFARDVAESTAYLPQTLLATPLVGPEGVLGVFSVLDRDPSRFDAGRDLHLAASFAARAAALLAEPAQQGAPELAALADLLHRSDGAGRQRLREALREILAEFA
jgi:signal transduction protein with GAF and PtsI domain